MKLEFKTHVCAFNALAHVLNENSQDGWFIEKMFTGEGGHIQIVFARHIEDPDDVDLFVIDNDRKWYQFWGKK